MNSIILDVQATLSGSQGAQAQAQAQAQAHGRICFFQQQFRFYFVQYFRIYSSISSLTSSGQAVFFLLLLTRRRVAKLQEKSRR
jgi:hypothetical protein